MPVAHGVAYPLVEAPLGGVAALRNAVDVDVVDVAATFDRTVSSEPSEPASQGEDPSGAGKEVCVAVYVLSAALAGLAYAFVVVVVDHVVVGAAYP